ncbi:MAG: hypothetical protein ACPLRR_07325 [Candidatus Saccharicenans sp.]
MSNRERGRTKGRNARRLVFLLRVRLSGLILLVGLSVFLIYADLSAQQGYLNLAYWNRSRVYSQTSPYLANEYENIMHLDLWQKTINYGIFSGWFDGRLSSAGLEAAHWYLNWQGFRAGQFSFKLRLGDHNLQLTTLGYRFTNYYPVYNYLRGVSAGFEHPKFGLEVFTGRVARLTGLLGNFYSLTEQTATGFLAHFEPDPKYYLGFGLIHTENEKSWSGDLLTRTNDILLIESELRFDERVKFVMDTRASLSAGQNDPVKAPGTSIRFGPLFQGNRWFLEVNYRRVDADFRSLSSEFAYDRDQEGLFTSWRYQTRRRVFLFGSFDYYHDNVDRRPELNTTDFWRVNSGFSLIRPPWPDLTVRLDFSAAGSRRPGEDYRSFISPGVYLQLAKKLGRFYPYLRARFQHYDDRVNDQRDFNYPSLYLGLRYSYLRNSYLMIEAENSRYYDYLENQLSALNRLRLANFSPFFFGTDFYGELSYVDLKSWYFVTQSSKRMELYLGLGRVVPLGFRVRLDFRASWPFQSDQPANYWLTLRLDRRFNWGEIPAYQGRTTGSVLIGTGKIEGLVFSDRNLNGIFDPGDSTFPGITFYLEDGSSASSDASGRFLFGRVPEGLHTVNLEISGIPADYYLLGPERRTIVVERRKASRLEYLLVEGATAGGVIFQDLNKNGFLDEEDQPLRDVLVILQAVEGEKWPEALRPLRTEELTCYSDGKGRFIFENILPGSYQLLIDEETLPKGLKLQTSLPLRIDLKPGQAIRNLNIIYLPRPVIYTGRTR